MYTPLSQEQYHGMDDRIKEDIYKQALEVPPNLELARDDVFKDRVIKKFKKHGEKRKSRRDRTVDRALGKLMKNKIMRDAESEFEEFQTELDRERQMVSNTSNSRRKSSRRKSSRRKSSKRKSSRRKSSRRKSKKNSKRK